MSKKIYVYGQELYECGCGVWRINDELFVCWNHEDRKQLMVEAVAQASQAIRNLGHELAKLFGIYKLLDLLVKKKTP